MYRISIIIGEIYSKYLPFAEKNKITLNLDISDSAFTVNEAEELKNQLDEHLKSALKRTPGGEITIALHDKILSITDNGTILSKPICKLLSRGHINVTSRVGFGTTVSINLNSSQDVQETSPTLES